MSAQVYSVPGQTEGEGKPSWGGKAQTYPLNYLFHMGVKLTIKNVHHPILFLLVGIGNTLAIFKTN